MNNTARKQIKEWIFDAAGTTDADDAVVNAAVDLTLTVAHVGRCWRCDRVAMHRDNIQAEFTCGRCGSSDTRRVKE